MNYILGHIVTICKLTAWTFADIIGPISIHSIPVKHSLHNAVCLLYTLMTFAIMVTCEAPVMGIYPEGLVGGSLHNYGCIDSAGPSSKYQSVKLKKVFPYHLYFIFAKASFFFNFSPAVKY